MDAGAAVHAVANVAPEAPTSTMPVDTVYADRIWLDWAEAVDADDDRLTYRVKYWTKEEARWGKLPTEQMLDTNRLEITGAAVANDELYWQVQAIDLWGEGPWSEVYSVQVVARPRALSMEMPAGGCQVGAAGGGWLGVLAVVALGRRRSSSLPNG